MAVQVKICGIKSKETAFAVLENGADFIGFNFSPKSKRKIDIKQAVILTNELKRRDSKSLSIVGLFFENSKLDIENAIKEIPFDYIQFVSHDKSISLDFLKNLKINLIPQVSVKGKIEDSDLKNYNSDYLILDNFKEGFGGGSGEVFEWKNIKSIKRKYLLAGGLNPSNVGNAVSILQPFGVDVASGVETSPGVKDSKLIKEFIKNAKRL